MNNALNGEGRSEVGKKRFLPGNAAQQMINLDHFQLVEPQAVTGGWAEPTIGGGEEGLS